MQQVSAPFLAFLESPQRDPLDLYEIYPQDYIPPSSGFDPTQAIERFCGAKEETEDGEGRIVTQDFRWNGLVYKREFLSRDPVSRIIRTSPNNVRLTFSNVDGYMGQFTLTQDIEGMWLVVRRVSRSLAGHSLVLFCGKLDNSQENTKTIASLFAAQFLGAVEYELPLRTYQTDDPEGRDPSDPLFQGFRFIVLTGTFTRTEEQTKRFLIFFTRKKKVTVTDQWSSFSGTPLGEPIPELVGGRAQVQGVPIHYADVGPAVKFIMALFNGELSAIENVRSMTEGLSQPHGVTVHLGEPGGTGTQTEDPLFPGSGFFSGTATIGAYVIGSDPATVDPAPTIVAVCFSKIPLPDEAGAFTRAGMTDNPVHVVRNFLTAGKYLNAPETLIDDEANEPEARYCDERLLDVSNAQRTFRSDAALAPLESGEYRGWRATGWVDTPTYRHQLGLDLLPPEYLEPPYEIFNPDSPPVVTVIPGLRKRFTINATMTSRERGLDYLHKRLLPAFRGYILSGANAKLKTKVEKPADDIYLRAGTEPGATEIAVDNIESWRASLRGKALVGVGLPTSETRRVTGSRYADGEEITIAVSGALAASGAAFTAGDDDPASALLTVTGAVGTITATIAGEAVSYTINGDDTEATAAALLTDYLNANPTLQRFVRAVWNEDATVSLYSRMGYLTLARPLEFAHSIAEETIRVMASFSDRPDSQADCEYANIRAHTFKWPLGGKSKTINQVSTEFFDARNDFAKTPYTYNDTPHQQKIRKVLTEKFDAGAIDNLHQVSRIARWLYAKAGGEYYQTLTGEPLRGSFMASWGAIGRGVSLLLEEGDVVCVSASAGGQNRFHNLPLRIEEMRIPQWGGPDFVGRLYATAAYVDQVGAHTVPLPVALSVSELSAPENLTLTEHSITATSSSVRGTFDFVLIRAEQYARVLIQRDGSVGYTDAGLFIYPDSNGQGAFDIAGFAPGTHWFKVRVESPGLTAEETAPVSITTNTTGQMEDLEFSFSEFESQSEIARFAGF